MLHVISLAQYALAHTRSWAVNSQVARVRLKAENDQLRQHAALLTEELRIKDARMMRIPAQSRPHYLPTDRMSILEVRAAHGWSMQQTADAFLVTTATIAFWMSRLDEQGVDALVQNREPVNRFPEFVRYAVQRLKTLCPTLGKVKIAEVLCRAGLHLGATTVGRILKESPRSTPRKASAATARAVTAKRPNHVWHIDLTTVPTGGGFWAPWLPFAVPQRWPFAWWLAVIVDHYSRRAMGIAVFSQQPTSNAIRAFVGRVIADANVTPKHLICDKGSIFWCEAFKRWCQRKTIRPRYGAVGKHGSIAVIERFIRTLKDEATRRILISQRRKRFRAELASFFAWYNGHRPHTTLQGKTPNEVYFRLRPANQRPRIEPRTRWPRPSPCAKPRTLIAGQPGDCFEIEVGFHDGRRHLPIVSLKRAA
ncbi:MAG: transposase [Planctomycetes bacterium]|nr:transposase [Planctomycetota bacterium]